MNKKSLLFRKQIFDERNNLLCGNVLVTVHAELKYFSIICLALLCFFLVFTTQLFVTQQSLISGYIDIETKAPLISTLGRNLSSDSLITSDKSNGENLIANIFVQSNSIGMMQIGKEIELRVRAYPYQKFGVLKAKVQNVTGEYVTYDANGIIQERQFPSADPFYRVILKLSDNQIRRVDNTFKLMPGMKVEAIITFKKVKLVDGLLN